MRVLLFAGLIVAAPDAVLAQPIAVPSDSRAEYTVLQVTPKPNGLVEILSQRVGPSGTSFAMREVNCRTNQARYIGEGDTRAEAMRRKNPPWKMGPLFEGSISWHVSQFACQRAAGVR